MDNVISMFNSSAPDVFGGLVTQILRLLPPLRCLVPIIVIMKLING